MGDGFVKQHFLIMTAFALQVENCHRSFIYNECFDESSQTHQSTNEVCAMFRSASYLDRYDLISTSPLSTSLYVVSSEEDRTVIPNTKRFFENYQMFYSSFAKHSGEAVSDSLSGDFKWMANALSRLDIKNALVQYSEADSMIDFYIVLADGMKLSVGRFIDDSAGDKVDFSIFNKKKLLVSGEINLDELVKRVSKVE